MTEHTNSSLDDAIRQAILKYRNGQPKDAAESFKNVVKADPSLKSLWLNIGASYLAAKEYDNALEAYHHMRSLSPHSAEAQYGIAMAIEATGNRRSALLEFRRAAHMPEASAKMWMSLAELSTDTQERLAAVRYATSLAQANLKRKKQTFTDAIQSASVLFNAQEFQTAQRAYELAISIDPTSKAARAGLSLTYYRQGNFFEAANENREILLKCPPPPPTSFSKEDFTTTATQALLAVNHTLQARNIPFFLVAGTLLGCIRESQPLQHDRDVDIGVMSDVDVSELMEAFRENPKFTVPPKYSSSQTKLGVSYGTIPVDIFRHFKRPSYIWYGFSKLKGDMKWKFSHFNTSSVRLLGMDFPCPSPAQQYLLETYGNWRASLPAYSSVLSSPARFGYSEDVMRYFAHSRISIALRQRSIKIVRATLAQCPRCVKNDSQITDRIASILDVESI